jgi:arabinan endo-1,5-alpha-L-arabinosidase
VKCAKAGFELGLLAAILLSACGAEKAPDAVASVEPTGSEPPPLDSSQPSATSEPGPTPSEGPNVGPIAPGDTNTGSNTGALDSGAPSDPGPDLGDDRCSVARLDPAQPPVSLTLSGALGAHDPALLEQDGVFYMFLTGNNVSAKTSTGLLAWQNQPQVFTTVPRPGWIAQQVPQATNLWAPDISFFGGRFHLYFSASSFGSNSSCIGHLSRESMTAGAWEDQGSPAVCSSGANDYNAIDPNAFTDIEGNHYLAFGSFWDGIRAIDLDASGARSGTAIYELASRGGGAIEAPYIVRRCGYYYLFVSFDRCCDGADSTYNIRVGRSENVLGPYVDREGRALLNGGGTLLVQGDDTWRGPGHNAVIFSGDRAYNVFHAYAATNGASMLRIAEIAWDDAGWPVSGGP